MSETTQPIHEALLSLMTTLAEHGARGGLELSIDDTPFTLLEHEMMSLYPIAFRVARTPLNEPYSMSIQTPTGPVTIRNRTADEKAAKRRREKTLDIVANLLGPLVSP